jgi:hypothetical protein
VHQVDLIYGLHGVKLVGMVAMQLILWNGFLNTNIVLSQIVIANAQNFKPILPID